MQIENQFEVAATPDRVYAFLLDVNNVAGCMPGAELTEVIDQDTFKGRVKIKVGPVTVAYSGNARVAERDAEQRRAVLEADGRETTGSGSARAKVTMSVEPAGEGSLVRLVSDFTVAGRVASFGRGMMEDVSRRLVGQMAQAIKERLEAAPAPAGAASEEAAAPAAAAAPEAQSLNALSLLWGVIWDRVKRLFGR